MAWQQGWRMRQLALSCGSQQSFGSMQRPPSHRIYNFKIKNVAIVQLETNLLFDQTWSYIVRLKHTFPVQGSPGPQTLTDSSSEFEQSGTPSHRNR